MSVRKAILIQRADSPEPPVLNPEGQSHEEPTDVGEPCDVTLMIDTEVTAGALDGKPYEYEDHRGYLHNLQLKDQRDNGEDPAPGIKDEIDTHDRGNSTRGTYHWCRRLGVDDCMRVECAKDGYNIEEYETDHSQTLLHGWSEDRQEDDIPNQVDVSRVHESRNED